MRLQALALGLDLFKLAPALFPLFVHARGLDPIGDCEGAEESRLRRYKAGQAVFLPVGTDGICGCNSQHLGKGLELMIRGLWWAQ